MKAPFFYLNDRILIAAKPDWIPGFYALVLSAKHQLPWIGKQNTTVWVGRQEYFPMPLLSDDCTSGSQQLSAKLRFSRQCAIYQFVLHGVIIITTYFHFQ
jgi:hypothetical protein